MIPERKPYCDVSGVLIEMRCYVLVFLCGRDILSRLGPGPSEPE